MSNGCARYAADLTRLRIGTEFFRTLSHRAGLAVAHGGGYAFAFRDGVNAIDGAQLQRFLGTAGPVDFHAIDGGGVSDAEVNTQVIGRKIAASAEDISRAGACHRHSSRRSRRPHRAGSSGRQSTSARPSGDGQD